ncbi:hypothetical protein [Fervidibacter sp.]
MTGALGEGVNVGCLAWGHIIKNGLPAVIATHMILPKTVQANDDQIHLPSPPSTIGRSRTVDRKPQQT